MALQVTWLTGMLVLNLLFDVLLVLGSYRSMEWRIGVGALGGTAVRTAISYAEATMEERLRSITVDELKTEVSQPHSGRRNR
jgi:hypothetical protein